MQPCTVYSPTLKPKCRCHYVTVALYIAPTNFHLVILSGTSLEVKWEPAADADQSPLTYTVTAEGVNVDRDKACHYHTRRLISHSKQSAGVDSVQCVSAGSEQWWTQQVTDSCSQNGDYRSVG